MKLKPKHLVLFLILTALVVFPLLKTHSPAGIPVMSPIGLVELKTTFPKAPERMPVYRVVGGEIIETISNSSPEYWKVRKNLPSEEEAVEIALKALERYGGVPEDAVLRGVRAEYVSYMDSSAGEVGREPTLVVVSFKREINGFPVVGPGGEITVFIGENGTVVDLVKIWRKLEYTKDVRIISPQKAYELLQNGDVLRKPMGKLDLEVVKIEPGYYAGGIGERQDYYYPVWIFHCRDGFGKNITLAVSALAEVVGG
ncbi:hypothetical protein [Geoglobus acetivorans]|uniref:Uncharacterized protein n=1 Tax=Geoglobus acetivorans TaxID=565033 RepID=A0ABZ3GZN9_GEOAI|nr:hypothetical protein [Geoglobus acetivorans]